jgi:hypothetical protein
MVWANATVALPIRPINKANPHHFPIRLIRVPPLLRSQLSPTLLDVCRSTAVSSVGPSAKLYTGRNCAKRLRVALILTAL